MTEFEDVFMTMKKGTVVTEGLTVIGGDDAGGRRRLLQRVCMQYEGERTLWIDDPFILDSVPEEHTGHRHTSAMILRGDKAYSVDAPEGMRDAKRVTDVIRRAFDGEVVIDTDWSSPHLSCRMKGGKKADASDIPAGVKIFAIIQRLVSEGDLFPGRLLILEDPEAHVPYSMQSTLGELIVLLAKDLGVKVVVTTDSPLLLLAIEGHSMKEGQPADYYMVRGTSDGGCETVYLADHPTRLYEGMSEAFEAADLLYRTCVKDDDAGGEERGCRTTTAKRSGRPWTRSCPGCGGSCVPSSWTATGRTASASPSPCGTTCPWTRT